MRTSALCILRREDPIVEQTPFTTSSSLNIFCRQYLSCTAHCYNLPFLKNPLPSDKAIELSIIRTSDRIPVTPFLIVLITTFPCY